MNWTKMGALANVGCLMVAIVTVALDHWTSIAAVPILKYLPLVSLSVCLALATWFNWKIFFRSGPVGKDKKPLLNAAARKAVTLGIRMLEEQCSDILRRYRELDQFERDHVRLPLSTKSWPWLESGNKWEYYQLRLWNLYLRLVWMTTAAELTWKEMGWADLPVLFHTVNDTSTVMANLIGDLEEFLQALGGKVTLLDSVLPN